MGVADGGGVDGPVVVVDTWIGHDDASSGQTTSRGGISNAGELHLEGCLLADNAFSTLSGPSEELTPCNDAAARGTPLGGPISGNPAAGPSAGGGVLVLEQTVIDATPVLRAVPYTCAPAGGISGCCGRGRRQR